MVNNKYFIKLSIFLYLLPLSLITGPFLPDLSITIISIFFLFWVFKNKKYKFFNEKIIIFFCLFYISIVCSSLLSTEVLFSLKSSFFYIRFMFFTLAVWALLEENYKIAYKLLYVFLFTFGALFFDTIYQFITGQNLLGFKYINPSNFRITSFFGKDEILGSYIARLFPFILSLIVFYQFKEKKNFKKVLIYFFIISSFLTTYLSGERTSFVLIVMSSILITLSCKSLRKFFLISLSSIMIIVTVISIFDDRIKKRMIDTTIKQMNLSGSNNDKRIVLFSKTYEGHYKIALNMFKEKPIIGHGPKIFRVFCQKPENFVAVNACTTHPHNIYMQFLSETGFIGFFIIFFVFCTLLFLILKNIYYNFFKSKDYVSDQQACIYIFYFTTLFPVIPSGNFFNNWLSVIYFLPAGFLLYFKHCKND